MTEMSNSKIRRFLIKGTFTGKLATVKKDGSSPKIEMNRGSFIVKINGIS
jgi:hypothetical protein